MCVHISSRMNHREASSLKESCRREAQLPGQTPISHNDTWMRVWKECWVDSIMSQALETLRMWSLWLLGNWIILPLSLVSRHAIHVRRRELTLTFTPNRFHSHHQHRWEFIKHKMYMTQNWFAACAAYSAKQYTNFSLLISNINFISAFCLPQKTEFTLCCWVYMHEFINTDWEPRCALGELKLERNWRKRSKNSYEKNADSLILLSRRFVGFSYVLFSFLIPTLFLILLLFFSHILTRSCHMMRAS